MSENQDRSGGDTVVFGEVDNYFVFIRFARARELASIHEALTFSETWEEFRSSISPEEYAYVLGVVGGSTFEEFLHPSEKPTLTAEKKMLGRHTLDLPIGERRPEMDELASEEALIGEFEAAGYPCIRDDQLVPRASGYVHAY